MPAARTAKQFEFLHRQNVRHFGTGRKMWFPEERDGTAYTVGVEAVEAPLNVKAAEDTGFLTLPDDALVLHATRKDFPFEPRPDDLFTFGVGPGSGPKYRIISATGAEDRYSHYRIVAERQQ
jgi:hypothetical protein